MSDFFPDPRPAPHEEDERRAQPAWVGPPEDMLPGIVPVELILGRSDQAVAMLAGMRAFPTGVEMTLLVRTGEQKRRFDLNSEVFDGPYHHDQDDSWQRDRLKWGFEFADGRRATNVDPWPRPHNAERTPDRPVLLGRGGGGGDRAVDRDYWLWPLPPAGVLTVVFQWPQLGIERTVTEIDADQIVAAAARSRSVWP